VKRQSIVLVLVPALAMLVVLPQILELPPLMFSENFNILQVLIALPFYLGLLAAPGYLYVWSGCKPHPGSRAWLLASLWAALIASTAGTIVSLPAIVPVPFAAGSVICSLVILTRFLRAQSASA
jgi:hypothetical protein